MKQKNNPQTESAVKEETVPEIIPQEGVTPTEIRSTESAESLMTSSQENPGEPAPSSEDSVEEEFAVLQGEFPHLLSKEQLPAAVLLIAQKEHIPLLDAYLRFRWQEEKRVAAEEQRQKQIAIQSVGSLSQGVDEPQPEQEAFLRAFRSALR